jgi:penicillin-binding protein 1A
MPGGIISVKIDPATGTRLSENAVVDFLGDLLGTDAPGMVEHFYQEFPPPDAPPANGGSDTEAPAAPADPTTATPGTPL